MGTKCPSAASPGDPLGTFPSLGKYLAAGAAKSPPDERRNSIIAPSSGPSGHLSLSLLAFGHLPLTRGVGPQGEG